MKNIILVFFFLLIGFKTIAQETINVDDIKVHSFVQTKAQPKEGIHQFMNNFINAFSLNGLPISNLFELKVKLRFIVEKDGSFSDIKIVSEDCVGAGEEAIRVLKTMPAWKPAIHNGKMVRSAFTLPMKIRVNEDDKKPDESQEKTLNEVEEKNEMISETYLKTLDNFLVNTDLFEFKCNCTFVKDDNNKEYRYESRDGSAYYQISIEKKDEKEVEQTIKEAKSNVIYHGGLVNEIKLSGMKATDISLSNGVGLFTNTRLILLYIQGYFISIIVSSYDSQVADEVTQHFKQTFKLKL